jgi:hypothetical protein
MMTNSPFPSLSQEEIIFNSTKFPKSHILLLNENVHGQRSCSRNVHADSSSETNRQYAVFRNNISNTLSISDVHQ